MPRGRKRKPAPPLPPKKRYWASVIVAEMVRDGQITLAEGWMLNLLAMFDWRGTGAVDVTIGELARWLGVSREHAQRMFARLRSLGLVDRGEDGRICVIYKSRDIATSLPTPLYGGGGISSPVIDNDRASGEQENARIAREESSPPPPDLSRSPDSCDAEITQFANHVISRSQKMGERAPQAQESGILPPIAAVCAHIGVESERGMRALARLGMGPRALLAWHRARSDASRPDRSGVGSMVKLAATRPDHARMRIRKTWEQARRAGWSGPDFCPQCGASLETSGRRPDACPKCEVPLRECPECGELAPRDMPCVYCGATGSGDAVSEVAAKPEPSGDLERVWRQAQEWLRVRMSERDFNTWIRDARLLEWEEGQFVIGVPNVFTRDWLSKRLNGLVCQALAEAAGVSESEVYVDYVIHAG